MPDNFAAVFATLKPVLARHKKHFRVKLDSDSGYDVDSKVPSTFPQHKGHPLAFGAIRIGKAYVSFHMMPVYMCPELIEKISPALKQRMQGKSCFNFKSVPKPELLADLQTLTDASVAAWRERKWL